MSEVGTLLTVNGYKLPNPSKYDISYKDLDSSNAYTSEAGYLVRDIVRTDHITIDVSWNKLKPEQTKKILSAISGKRGLGVRYLDKRTNSFVEANALDENGVERKFYATDRNVGIIKAISLNNGYESLSFQLIEY